MSIDSPPAAQSLRLIIITPHNEQIRYEFARAFSRWHQERFGQPVVVEYNVPGGTSEIRKMLEAQFSAAAASGREPGGEADLVFGGGSFEHDRLKHFVTVPVLLSDDWLASVYGNNQIADSRLYDPDKFWFGAALSSFGIVYNNDVLANLHLAQPHAWRDLCWPELENWVALVNPGQSGSVTTAFESILKSHGWHEGWAILRRAGANARYFSGSSLKPPIDVSQASAAMGVCIDFYGRYQSQALSKVGDADRIGYIDPPGATSFDADPISMIRNAPHPDTARRFIEFCLSDHGQALWQFQATGGSGFGPERFELRRLPIVRSMYQSHFDEFIDKVNPFEIAAPAQHSSEHFRDFIAPLFAAVAMDTHTELRRAWRAIIAHPDYRESMDRAGGSIVQVQHASDPTLRRMLELFDELPEVAGPHGSALSLDDLSAVPVIRAGWLRGQWKEHQLWHPDASPMQALRQHFVQFFRARYRMIAKLAEESSLITP